MTIAPEELTQILGPSHEKERYEGNDVGVVTSGTKSPVLGYGIAMGYVSKALSVPGTKLQIDVRGRIAEAEVIKGPFYRRDT